MVEVHNGYTLPKRNSWRTQSMRQDPASWGAGEWPALSAATQLYTPHSQISHTNGAMTQKSKTKSPESNNPLWGYHAAMETLVGVARGRIRSEMRLEAARTLLEHCSVPPTVSWDYEDDDNS